MITCNVALESVSLLLNVRYEALDQNFFIIKFGIHFSSKDSHDFIINILIALILQTFLIPSYSKVTLDEIHNFYHQIRK